MVLYALFNLFDSISISICLVLISSVLSRSTFDDEILSSLFLAEARYNLSSFSSLCLYNSIFRGNSPSSGETSSAAADGVDALTSDTKSHIVKSVSWPTPDTTGILHEYIALARFSSLKAQRSSLPEPEPDTLLFRR